MVAANHATLAHIETTFEDLILTFWIDLSEHKCRSPTDRGMSRRIRTVGRKLLLLYRIASHLIIEREGALTVVEILCFACAEVAGIFAHTYNELVDLGGILL